MRRLFGAALVCVAALALLAWWMATAAKPKQVSASAASAELAAASIDSGSRSASAPNEALNVTFQTILLPDQRNSALPNSVRIGLGYVAPEEAQAFQESRGAGEGAGPSSVSELATVERWISVVAQKLPDGSVQVGPLSLPRADRYDLQARGEGGLHFYTTSFTADAFPASVKPIVAAGMRVLREPATNRDVRVLLRRVGEQANAALWQALLSTEAAQLLGAFGETPLAVSAEQLLAPLPPGPIEVVLEVDGIVAETRSVTLIAGEFADVQFDPVKQEVAKAITATLQLAFVVEGKDQPLPDLQVSWVGHENQPSRISDATGVVSFPGVDRQKIQRFNLQFPTGDIALPVWPAQKMLEVSLESQNGISETARVIRKTIELRPLQWLLVQTGAFQVPTEHRAGNPYPIFVLQQQRAGRWLDAASENFIPVPEGIAVSVEEPGQFRVAALQSPWSIWYSTAVELRQDNSDGKNRASLIADSGRDVEVVLRRNGVAIANAQFALSAPIRGLPATQITSDSLGRIKLAAVTVPSVRLEGPGYAVANVDLRSTSTTVALQPEAESSER